MLGKLFTVAGYTGRNEAELKFYEGRIYDAIIHNPHGLTFSPEVITHFGFERTPPSAIDTSAFILWNNLPNVTRANVYLVGTKKTEDMPYNFKIYFNFH